MLKKSQWLSLYHDKRLFLLLFPYFPTFQWWLIFVLFFSPENQQKFQLHCHFLCHLPHALFFFTGLSRNNCHSEANSLHKSDSKSTTASLYLIIPLMKSSFCITFAIDVPCSENDKWLSLNVCYIKLGKE